MAHQTQRANAVTVTSINQGIQSAYAYLEKKGQARPGEWDFHNLLYCQIEKERKNGYTPAFWAYLKVLLWDWRAMRNKYYPKSLEDFSKEENKRHTQLTSLYNYLNSHPTVKQFTIEYLEWTDVAPLFDLACEIKGVRPPTFGSKMCHFLFPAAYFVIDSTLVKRGWFSYEEYWKNCKEAWMSQQDQDKEKVKDVLCKEIRTALQPGQDICGTYPWATKITELCQFTPR